MKRLLCALLALVLALVCVPAMADVARVTEEPKEFTVGRLQPHLPDGMGKH